MRIDEVHELVVHARRMEHEVAAAAEMLSAAATGDLRRVLETVAHGARIRQLLWDSRLPDTSYISTGRAHAIVAPTEGAAPPVNRSGLTDHLARLSGVYADALSKVNPELDPMTHELLTRGLSETGSASAHLAG